MTNIGKNIYLAFVPYANFFIQLFTLVKNKRYFKKGWIGALILRYLILIICLEIHMHVVQPYLCSIMKELGALIGGYLFSVVASVLFCFFQRKYLD